MNTLTPPNVVHESETQRQYVRARLPSELELDTPEGTRRYPLRDLSGGGMGFDGEGGAFAVGQLCKGRVHLTLNNIALAVPVSFYVRYVDSESGIVGGRFEQLDTSTVATLRRVVSAFLGGELISAGDILHTLSRNNFTSPRPGQINPAAPPRTRFARYRATAQTSFMLLLGLAALGYTAQQFDKKVFGSSSIAARVSGPQFVVEMPRDGVFRSLVPANGLVKKGSAIGSFETSMLKLADVQNLKTRLTPEEIQALLGQDIRGTITSPCDCRVVAVNVTNDQYVGKGQRILELAPVRFEPYVRARFSFADAEKLQPGTRVSLHISGESVPRNGHVTLLRGDGVDELSENVVVMIKPETPLSMALVNRPAQVSVSGSTWLASRVLGDHVAVAHAEPTQ